MESVRGKSAIISGWQTSETERAIKKLSLLFDHVLYIPVSMAVFKHGPDELKKRVKYIDESKPGEGPCYIEDFSWESDICPGLFVDLRTSRVGSIAQTATALFNGGVLSPATVIPPGTTPFYDDDEYQLIQSALLKYEMGDQKFMKNIGDDGAWVNAPLNFGGMTLKSSNGDSHQLVYFNPPTVWNASSALTEIAFAAHKFNAYPVIADPKFRTFSEARKSWIMDRKKELRAQVHYQMQ